MKFLKNLNRKIRSNIYVSTASLLVLAFLVLAATVGLIGYWGFMTSYSQEYLDSTYKSALVASQNVTGVDNLDIWNAVGADLLEKLYHFDETVWPEITSEDFTSEDFYKNMIEKMGVTDEEINQIDKEKLLNTPYMSNTVFPDKNDKDYYEELYCFLYNAYWYDYVFTKSTLKEIMKTQKLSAYYVIIPDDDYKNYTLIIDCPDPSLNRETRKLNTRCKTASDDFANAYKRIFEGGSKKEIILPKGDASNLDAYVTAMVPIYGTDENYQKTDKVTCILCAERNMSEFLLSRRNFIQGVVGVTIIFLIIITFICLYLIKRRIITPIEVVSKEAKRFASETTKIDDLNLRKKVGPIAEIKELATALEKMESDTINNINEITTMTRDQERVFYEVSLASQIQQGMLPKKDIIIKEDRRYDVQAKMFPAKNVGGDFYDFFMIDDNHIAILVADVSDKGIGAALFMAITKTLIKSRARLGGSASEILSNVDATISEKNPTGMFVTVWLGIVDLETGEVNACNAGHDYPAIMHSSDDYRIEKLQHGSPIGFLPGMEFPEYYFTLKSGDRIFLYTDGLVEAKRSDGARYTTDRMLTVLNNNKATENGELISIMKNDVDEFAGDEPQFDDITMLSFEYLNNPS